jgi:NAD(P)-dependent dehydrogenase (short-subunit alcohol dehydrogenase family)
MTQYVLESLFSLENKTAVVIGGTGELCGAIAMGMAQAGAQVILVGRSVAKAEARIEAIRSLGKATPHFFECHVNHKSNFESLLSQVLQLTERVDILVNGAGVNSPTPFLEISDEELKNIFEVNFQSVFWGCQVFGGDWIAKKQLGVILNIGSLSGTVPLSRVFSYSASKAAVHNLSKNLAREWGPHGIRVNTLVPGFFPAEQNRKVLNAERVERILAHTPMHRFGQPDELIGAALLLVGDAGRFMTGTELVVDGGFSAMTI